MQGSEARRPHATVGSPRSAPLGRAGPGRPAAWLWAAAALVLLLVGLGLGEATGVTDVRGTVIRLFSPDGTLVVEVDDPAVSVTVDGADLVITGAGAKEIRLKPGQYKVQASKDGKVVRQELVTVTRNGRQVVRISKEAAPLTGCRAVGEVRRRTAGRAAGRGGGAAAQGAESRLRRQGHSHHRRRRREGAELLHRPRGRPLALAGAAAGLSRSM